MLEDGFGLVFSVFITFPERNRTWALKEGGRRKKKKKNQMMMMMMMMMMKTTSLAWATVLTVDD